MKKISRKDAIKQNLKYYFTNKACPAGHITKRKVHNATCYTCAQLARNTHESSLWAKAIQKLGGKCITCGFNDIRALQIDHVKGGGVREHRKLGANAVYRLVLLDTKGLFQCLCANCNWIKRRENNENGNYLEL
jgi:hypothetical protein